MPSSGPSPQPTLHRMRSRSASVAFAAAAAALIAGVLWGLPAHAAFPGVNGKIAFERFQDGTRDIYAMNPDGSGQTNLTRSSANDSAPSWSPDGQRIAFVSDRDASTSGESEIYVMNADGAGQTRLTNNDGPDRNPAWSPDGRRIAFDSRRDGQTDIYVMNADGSGLTNLTNNASPDHDPAWSPDGRRIAFFSTRHGGAAILVMNADGSGQTRLTTSPWDVNPAWSPDGRRIAFASSRDYSESEGFQEIYVMNADGSGQTRLTNNAADDRQPDWSADGKKLAFSSRQGGRTDIYAMNPDGSGQTNLSNNSALDFNPSWQRLPGEDPPQVTGITPAQQKLRRGRAAVFTAQVSGAAERLEWILPRGGTITGSADQSSVRFRPRPGRENTVSVRAIGPGGVSEAATHTFTAPQGPKGRIAKRALRLVNQNYPVYAMGTAQALGEPAKGEKGSCGPMTLKAGALEVSGERICPIHGIEDFPETEHGLLGKLARLLNPGGGDLDVLKFAQALSLGDAYYARGIITVNDGLLMARRSGTNARIVIYPQAGAAVASSQADLVLPGPTLAESHPLAREKNFFVRMRKPPPRGGIASPVRIPIGSFARPSSLGRLGGLKLPGDVKVDLLSDGSTRVRANLRLPSALRVAGASGEAEVDVRVTPTGLALDQMTIGPIDVNFGALKVSDFKVDYTRANNEWRGQGRACVAGGTCLDMVPGSGGGIRGITIRDGKFHSAGAELQFDPRITVYPGVELERVGFGLALKPTRMTGNVGVRIFEILRLDGRLILAFPSKDQPLLLRRDEIAGFPCSFYHPVGSNCPDANPPRFTGTTFGVTADAFVTLQRVGEVKLGSAYALYEHPGYVAFGGRIERRFLGVVRIKGSVDGELNATNGRFNLIGRVDACIQLLRERCAGGVQGVISNRGAGGCLEVNRVIGSGTRSIGGGVYWSGGSRIWLLRGCRWQDFQEPSVRSGGAAAAQAGSPHVVRIRPGDRSRMIQVDGNGAAPLVRVSGPDGRLVESDPEQDITETEDGVIAIAHHESEEGSFTAVGLQDPPPGAYRVERLDGSPVVEAITEAEDPPAARVSGRVRGSGKRRVLNYVVRRRPDQRVTFLELTSTGDVNEIGVVRGGGRGRLPFRPAPARGRSRVIAQFELADLPAERRRVVRFNPPRPALGKPRALRVRRAGSRLRVSWRRVRGARRYEVAVTGSDRRQVSRTTRKPRIVIKKVPRSTRGRVTVRALDRRSGATIREGGPAKARYRRTARRKTSIRPLPRCVQRRGKIRCRASR